MKSNIWKTLLDFQLSMFLTFWRMHHKHLQMEDSVPTNVEKYLITFAKFTFSKHTWSRDRGVKIPRHFYVIRQRNKFITFI